MQKHFREAAVILTVVATVGATVLRVLLTPAMQDSSTGQFSISYVIIGVLLAAILANGVLMFTAKGSIPLLSQLNHRSRVAVGAAAVLLGAIFELSALFDGWMWMAYGKTPPPNEYIISKLDSATLLLTLIFAALAGLFMIWLGIVLITDKLKRSASLSLAALAPVAWIWVRLVRYEVSYASAIRVSQSFYDFVMLIFTMLFLFTFARFVSGTGERSPKGMLVFALSTVLLSLSGTLTSVLLFLGNETEAYNASRLASVEDFGIGVFALVLAAQLVLARTNGYTTMPNDDSSQEVPEVVEQEQQPLTVPADDAQTPSIDDILNDVQSFRATHTDKEL